MGTTFLEVKPLSPSDRFMIARHLPELPCEVGLPKLLVASAVTNWCS